MPVDRVGRFFLIVTATLTLALATLVVPRRPTLAVSGVAIAWLVALGVARARQPTVDRVATPNGDVWLLARSAGVARVSIAPGAAWVPVVESMRHWRTLTPRITVDADGRATLELTLPAGARVCVTAAEAGP